MTKEEKVQAVCDRLGTSRFVRGSKVRLNPELLNFNKCLPEHLEEVLTVETVVERKNQNGEHQAYYYAIKEWGGDLYPSHWLVAHDL